MGYKVLSPASGYQGHNHQSENSRIMSLSPEQKAYSSYFAMSPRANTDPAYSPRSPHLEIPQRAASRTSSPTQYEFIMSTGDESATTARQKLKTVRSHVMKNYLQQQQQQRQGRGSKDIAFPGAAGDRRQSKQRTRSNRSASQEFDQTQPVHGMGTPACFSIGTLFAGVSLIDSFAGHRTEYHGMCNTIFLCPINKRMRWLILTIL